MYPAPDGASSSTPPPHPDPTVRQPARVVASTPQRYTAPSRRSARGTTTHPHQAASRMPFSRTHDPRRVGAPDDPRTTGTYAVPAGQRPITEVRGGRSTGSPSSSHPAAPPRPPAPPAPTPRRRPPSAQQPPPPPRQSSGVVVARPAIIVDGSANRPERPERRGRPARQTPREARGNVFGSDLISERSLDEVILGYLAEEDSEES
ncbi:MAG: hypothetical protein KC503_01735 [Myxococcales bacterium]|nr:hypothetical protein [Myxococcales bacterium]